MMGGARPGEPVGSDVWVRWRGLGLGGPMLHPRPSLWCLRSSMELSTCQALKLLLGHCRAGQLGRARSD